MTKKETGTRNIPNAYFFDRLKVQLPLNFVFCKIPNGTALKIRSFFCFEKEAKLNRDSVSFRSYGY